MNYFTLLARLLLIGYSLFLMLFAIGEGITGEGFSHAIMPVIILVVVTVFWKRPGLSAVAMTVLFIGTLWFFHTYEQTVTFLIISLPLAVAGLLFMVGVKFKTL